MKILTDQITRSSAETERLASALAKTLGKNSVLLLKGDLGSGKTTFVRGLAHGLGIANHIVIHSPSFTLVNEYPGKIPLIHVDLYRLNSFREVLDLGVEDFFGKGVVAIEWAEKGETLWPSNAVGVEISHAGLKSRRVVISFGGQKEK